jgi:PQ loop repeat protein
MEILGWAGTALVIVAYVPQIHHLYVEKYKTRTGYIDRSGKVIWKPVN